MTGQPTGRSYLRIVSSMDDAAFATKPPHTSVRAVQKPKQPMLFSDASLHTLGFVKAGDLDPTKFLSLIRDAKPLVIFDLRPFPSFAGGRVTRRSAFSLFEQMGVTYYDVAGVLDVSRGRDALLNPALLIDSLQVNIVRSTKRLIGPVFFFVDDDLFFDHYFSAVARLLPHQDGRGWDIACWPSESSVAELEHPRDLVFVSHANPQDNELALWLSARLAASGYKVWSDVTRLIGGEVFWDTIEDAIRKSAAKVIVLLSKDGQNKPGLLDEVNVAIATERTERIPRFVIPVRVDDLPFSEIRANLARKNVIDGYGNLAGAFGKLLSILREDGVPAGQQLSHLALRQLHAKSALGPTDEKQWSILLENKLQIVNWPKVIRKFRTAGDHELPFPTHPVSGGLVTFEDWDAIADALGGQVRRAGEAAFDPGDTSGWELVFADRGEGRRAVASLTRQAWDRACDQAGFKPYALASGNRCWFLRNGFVAGNRVRYSDAAGVERQRALVGESPKRRVYWHFAIEVRPNVQDDSLRIVPHVLFSNDGEVPLESHDRQHAMRRGFCRSWWNARWRELLLASLSFLSSRQSTAKLPVSQHHCIEISARLTRHEVDGSDVESGASGGPVFAFDEPTVAVGFGQTSDYPKKGLLLFGPVPFERNPKVVRAGVIGTGEGIELFRIWSKQFTGFQSDPSGSRNSLPFPGFEAVFGAKWMAEPVHAIALSRTDLINTIRLHDRHQAIFRCVGLFVERITKAVREDDVNVDIWYVVIPDEIYIYGRPASRVPSAIAIATPGAMGQRMARRFSPTAPSLFPEDNEEAQIYDHHLDFHHQLKARLLGVHAVTQILRESSLATVTAAAPLEGQRTSEGSADEQIEAIEEDDELEEKLDGVAPSMGEGFESDTAFESNLETRDAPPIEQRELEVQFARPMELYRRMQDRASVAWNLATTTFFKAGGRPWRVSGARESVCYIGLIFKRDPSVRSLQACCGAQMFLQDSDGLVFKGAMGPWYSPETGQFHLSRMEAAKLIGKILQSYGEEHKEPPRELFIHGRTRFNDEEWKGFTEAIDLQKTKLTGVRISRTNEFKLFSSGELAVRRGTAIRLSRRVGLLWTSGYVRSLGTYPGRETPNPLRIEVVKETAQEVAIEVVMKDIMMLTKMNFNSCIYSDGIPVTMRFADAIGDVLLTAKDKEVPPLPFRYYI